MLWSNLGQLAHGYPSGHEPPLQILDDFLPGVINRMFSDEEDFAQQLSDVEDSQELVEEVSGNAKFHRLMHRRAHIEKRMNDVDELARQVSSAFISELTTQKIGHRW